MNDTPTAAPVREDFLIQLRRVSADRMATWCSETELPCGLFHATELGGEVGGVLNVVKKLHREAQGWRSSRATVADLAEEIGDVVVCLDKLAAYYGTDLAQATAAKFNATSEKVGLPHRLPEGATPAPMFTFSADADANASETHEGEQSVRSVARDGYASAFYEIATMLGIGAQAASPVDVWRDQMRPKLEALTARTDAAGTVDRTVLAKLLNEAAGPRRIAGADDAPLFADSKPEVQEY